MEGKTGGLAGEGANLLPAGRPGGRPRRHPGHVGLPAQDPPLVFQIRPARPPAGPDRSGPVAGGRRPPLNVKEPLSPETQGTAAFCIGVQNLGAGRIHFARAVEITEGWSRPPACKTQKERHDLRRVFLFGGRYRT